MRRARKWIGVFISRGDKLTKGCGSSKRDRPPRTRRNASTHGRRHAAVRAVWEAGYAASSPSFRPAVRRPGSHPAARRAARRLAPLTDHLRRHRIPGGGAFASPWEPERRHSSRLWTHANRACDGGVLGETFTTRIHHWRMAVHAWAVRFALALSGSETDAPPRTRACAHARATPGADPGTCSPLAARGRPPAA